MARPLPLADWPDWAPYYRQAAALPGGVAPAASATGVVERGAQSYAGPPPVLPLESCPAVAPPVLGPTWEPQPRGGILPSPESVRADGSRLSCASSA
eukprot:2267184-Alexandrium_andersonii.AAC.1